MKSSALAALGTLLLLSASGLRAASVSDLVVNELMADNTVTVSDELGDFDDWIEILNPTDTALSMDGLYLSDDPANLTRWPVPPGTVIAPGEHLLVWADNEPLEGPLHATFKLTSAGEVVLLVAADGTTVLSELTFPSLGPDISYGRFPDGSAQLFRMDVPTPRAPNQGPSGSAQARLNEVLANNVSVLRDEHGDFDPWVEVLNASGVDLDLLGLHLTDDGGQPTKWTLPGSTSLAPGAFLLVWLDGEPSEGPLHAGFALPPSGGTVRLFSADGLTQLDELQIGSLPADTARGRFPDGEDKFQNLRPTPGDLNEAFDPSQGLVIGEVLASNLNGLRDNFNEPEDWIEIQNISTSSRNVAGMFLTDDLSNPTRWQIPNAPASDIPAGGYLVIFADGQPSQGAYHATFKLDADGEAVGLFNTLQQAGQDPPPIDSVHFGGTIPEETDVSEARFGPRRWDRLPTSTPTPGAANAFGLTTDQIVDSLTGAFLLLNPQVSAEADANRDGRHDVADVVRRVNAD